jgi:hypothetical protein
MTGTMKERPRSPRPPRAANWKRKPATPPAEGAQMRPLGSDYSLPSETNKYTHVFMACSA